MSYLVLARKWRPTQFAEVTGQDHVTRTLTNAIRMGRVAHSFLFTGARGVGKTSTARILAKALNCAEGPTETPCGVCPSCQEVPEGRSLDVLEIDGASNRGIGEIRELRDGVRYAPSRDTHKIYIIDEVHMLTQEAFNALLKTLEEPPAHVKFIFATTEPQKIPVTILSRCQRFDFKRVPAKTLIGRLEHILEAEGVDMDESALHLVARESEGSVRDALSLLDRIIASSEGKITGEQVGSTLGVADRRWLHTLVTAILNRSPSDALRVVHEVNHYGFDLTHFSKDLVQFCRDLLVIRMSGDGAQRITDLADSEFESMKYLVGGRDSEDFERFLHIALRGANDMNRAPMPQIVLEATVVRMASLRPIRPMDDLLKRLMILEKALPEGAVIPLLADTPEGQGVSQHSPVSAVQVASLKGEPSSNSEAAKSEDSVPVVGVTDASNPAGASGPPGVVEKDEPPAPMHSSADKGGMPTERETFTEVQPERSDTEEPELKAVASSEATSTPEPVEAEIQSEPSSLGAEESVPYAEPVEENKEGEDSVSIHPGDATEAMTSHRGKAQAQTPEQSPSIDPEIRSEEGEVVRPGMELEILDAELTDGVGTEVLDAVVLVPTQQEPEALEELTPPSVNPESTEAQQPLPDELPSGFQPDGQDALDGFLSYFATQNTALAGQFTQGTLTLREGKLSAQYRSELFITRFQNGEAHETLTRALRAYFANPVVLDITSFQPEVVDRESHYEEEERVRQEGYTVRRQAIRESPEVRSVAEAFDGEVKQVRLIGIDT